MSNQQQKDIDNLLQLMNRYISKIKIVSGTSILFILNSGSIIEYNDGKFQYLRR